MGVKLTRMREIESTIFKKLWGTHPPTKKCPPTIKNLLTPILSSTVTLSHSLSPQVLQDMVPPKKHLLRHQPANAQIGLMEGNTFCTTLQPRLFTMDLNVMEHKVFYTEVGSWGGGRGGSTLNCSAVECEGLFLIVSATALQGNTHIVLLTVSHSPSLSFTLLHFHTLTRSQSHSAASGRESPVTPFWHYGDCRCVPVVRPDP